MNADPAFAGTIVRTAVQTDRVTVGAICADVATESAHRSAVTHVEKNQRHVIGAYAAIWVITALFLLYLLRRQTRLRGEIEQLRRDLEAAAKGGA
jgi:CcmD family protein